MNAVYTPIDYLISLVTDGKTVSTIAYNITTESIVEPAVPEKTGYVGKWENYNHSTDNFTINAFKHIAGISVFEQTVATLE